MDETSKTLITVHDLTVDYVSHGGLFGRNKHVVRVLDGLELCIIEGETLGIVGESGCGKTTLGNALLRFIKPTRGQVMFQDTDILQLDKRGRRGLRRHMQLVFQNPHSSLDPRMDVLNLVAEPLRTHTDMTRQEMARRVEELLVEVGLSAEFMNCYPHQLSGGQAQRVAVARAIALSSSFIVLDEPTSALDVSVQAQIVNLLLELQVEHNLTYMFISHNLSVVQHVSDRIAVMYLGEIVELASSETIFADAQHPYTQALLSATPVPDPDKNPETVILSGNVPSLADPPSGCRFHTRCPQAFEACDHIRPEMVDLGDGHQAACLLLSPSPHDDDA